MKNYPKVFRVPFHLITMAGLLFSGCSDSSTPTANTSAPTTTSSAPSENEISIEETSSNSSNASSEILPLRGTLIISERSGKRILDAWFSRSVSVAVQRDLLWSDSENVCFDPETIEVSPNVNFSSLQKLERAAESINITSRAGDYVTLSPQQLGDSVVYASDALWQDDGLPEDALLSLFAAQGYTSVQGIGLSPLSPIERLNPVSGQLMPSDSAIRWQMVPDSDTLILLQITAIGEKESVDEAPDLRSVQCELDDDGSFNLPDLIRDALGKPTFISVTTTRYREQLVSGVDGDLHIVQRSQN